MQAQLIHERHFYSMVKMANNEYWVRKNFKVIGKFKTFEDAKQFIGKCQKEGLNDEQNSLSR